MDPEPAGGDPSGAYAGIPELHLADWRRQVTDLYAAVRTAPDPAGGWRLWRDARARLFAGHPQSPLPPAQRTPDRLPRYFPYGPALRVTASVEPCPSERTLLPSSAPGEEVGATLVARAHFTLDATPCSLGVYWLDGYAGGLFVSFRDATSGTLTSGSGRYLLDTAKGADLGVDDDRLVLDFNFAYQPSCSYDPRWACPLAPAANRLDVAVLAGERM